MPPIVKHSSFAIHHATEDAGSGTFFNDYFQKNVPSGLRVERQPFLNAVRFAFVLLAVLLGIQLTTFTEYLETQARLRRAKAQAEQARALTAAMSEVAAAANVLQQTVTDILKELLNRLLEDLKSDFAALDAKVADLRGQRPIPSEPERNLAMQQLNAPG